MRVFEPFPSISRAALMLGILFASVLIALVHELKFVEALAFSVPLTALLTAGLWVFAINPMRRSVLEERARSAALMESSAQSVLTVDLRGRIQSSNPAVELLFLRSQEQLSGQCVHTLGIKDLSWLCGCEKPLELCHRSGRLTHLMPERLATLDWLVSPLTVCGSPLLVISLNDVSAEVDALTRSKLQAAALDAAASCIFMTNIDGSIEWINHAFRSITGWGDEAIGQSPRILDSGRHDDEFYRNIWDTLASGESWKGELISRHKDGTMLTCQCSVTPVGLVGGHPTHFVFVAQDITQQQELKRRLAVSERMASVGTLAAGVAHEINNPLSFIKSNLTYVRDYILTGEGDPADIEDALNDASMGAERVRKIVLALKGFSHVEDGRMSDVDLRGPVEQALTMATSQLRNRAKLVVELEHTPRVRGDEGRLSQVFLNLIVNAAQAIPEGAPHKHEVRVTSSVTDRYVEIAVSDTGCGMSEQVRRRLFDPFFTTKPVGVGTGLGLYICHNLISAMQGEMSVESTEGKGSTFRVRLQLAASHIDTPVPTLHAA
jgi:PAS domain S-box-containing protein